MAPPLSPARPARARQPRRRAVVPARAQRASLRARHASPEARAPRRRTSSGSAARRAVALPRRPGRRYGPPLRDRHTASSAAATSSTCCPGSSTVEFLRERRPRRLPARLGHPGRARRRQQPRDLRRRATCRARGRGPARDGLRRAHARRLLPRRRDRRPLRHGPRTTPRVRNLILMATPIDFGEMGADGRRSARGPARSRRPHRRDRQRPGRRPLQRLLHARADHGDRAAGDAARAPLERRVRRGLPGDGAVVARPRARSRARRSASSSSCSSGRTRS